ncbi:uncharacterized protein VNE69_03009 [Vairimorpha necatrix]|uniref:Uncharacterized protein n=1 Tax=Vairimorpha necatrix TaxID=6039 RepID=A0AAX4JAB2_9MICR
MNTLIFFLTTILVQTNKKAYHKIRNNLIEKIKKKEYLIYNSNKTYARIDLYLSEFDKAIVCEIEGGITSRSYLKNVFFNVTYENKTINQIVSEIEENIMNIPNIINDEYSIHDANILVYNSLDVKRYPIMKKIIENMKHKNCERRENKIIDEIFFEIICDKDCLLYKMIYNRTGPSLSNKKILSCNPEAEYSTNYNENTYYIRLRIDVLNYCYFFELNTKDLDVENLYSFDDINIKFKSIFDREILRQLLILYNSCENNLLNSVIESIPLKCTPISVVNISSYFKIRIKYEKIIFEDENIAFYYSKKKFKHLNNKTYINEESYTEIKEIIESILVIKKLDQGRAVDFFYRILKFNKKLEFLIMNILNKPGTGLYLIFIHLLFFLKIMNEDDLKIIIEQKDNELKKIMIAKNLLKKLSDDIDRSFYLVKVCLLIETERYINYNVELEPIFKTFKVIGELIESKKMLQKHIIMPTKCSNCEKEGKCNCAEQPIEILKDKFRSFMSNKYKIFKNDEETIKYRIYIKKGSINWLRIFDEMKNIHIGNILKYKKKVMKKIYKLSSLFTGIDTTDVYKYDIKKEELIQNLGFYENEVEENNKKIGILLLTNTIEDEKFEDEVVENNEIFENEMAGIIKTFVNENTQEYENLMQ